MQKFELETNIRRLVSEILDPISERSSYHHSELKDLKAKNEYLMKKVEDLDRSIKVDLNLRGTLADLKKRVHNMVRYLLNLFSIGY